MQVGLSLLFIFITHSNLPLLFRLKILPEICAFEYSQSILTTLEVWIIILYEDIMKCPTCQHVNCGRAIFCLKYGEKLEIKCPQYGNSLPPEALFCDKILTTHSSIEGERKLVFVFFADVSILALLNTI